MFRLYEIPLQITHHYCSQISSLSLKTAFVTSAVSIGYKQACKRCPFALQNMPFYTSKDALLHCKRASFTTQKGVDGKRKGKEIDKRRAELRKEKRPKTKEKEPPQAPPKEGMWEETGGEEGWPQLFGRRGCAWRDTECYVLGRWKREELKIKIHGLILKDLNFGGQKYALSHTDHLSLNS